MSTATWPPPASPQRFVKRCRGRWSVAYLHGFYGEGDYDCGPHYNSFEAACRRWLAEERIDATEVRS